MNPATSAMTGFEGSYLGSSGKISERAVMECKVCWTPYDPDVGDEYRQVLPGTPFLALPDDWKCPNCDAPKEQFMVLDDPGSEEKHLDEVVARRTAVLVEEFKDVFATSMRGLPVVNTALHVQAVGFRAYGDDILGVLITPWFMNIVLLPQDETRWTGLKPGSKEVIAFASGDYEFIHIVREKVKGYKACSLFSPMDDFSSQMQAVEVAMAVMPALFDAGNREETDRSSDIRKMREEELAVGKRPAAEEGQSAKPVNVEPSRRGLLGLDIPAGERDV